MDRPGTLQMRGTLAPSSREGTVRIAVALGSLGAASIHFAVVGEHRAEDPLFGLFFAAVGAVQLLWAIAFALRPSAFVCLSGAAMNAGIVAIWLASRTVGMPLGPHPWTPEPIGALDLISTTLEVVIVLGTATLLAARSTRREIARAARWVGAIAAVVAVLVGTMMAVAAVLAALVGLAGLGGHH